MGSDKLKSAADAAGYAMVNPEDFAGDPRPQLILKAPTSDQPTNQPNSKAQSRWWPSFDILSMSGGKATA
jgi:hypothetical protein